MGFARKIRGVVLTTELVLLIVAVIIFATVAFFGIAKTVIQQATSPKSSIAVIRADAWNVSGYIVVSAYVQNTGNTDVTVSLSSVTEGSTSNTCSISSSSVTLKPGEVRVLSGMTSTSCNIPAGRAVFVIVSTGSHQVGIATIVNNPS